jgi:hypothetical protein
MSGVNAMAQLDHVLNELSISWEGNLDRSDLHKTL